MRPERMREWLIFMLLSFSSSYLIMQLARENFKPHLC
jgi:hypothetical protein